MHSGSWRRSVTGMNREGGSLRGALSRGESSSAYSGDLSSQGSHDTMSMGSRASLGDTDGIANLRRGTIATAVHTWHIAVPKVFAIDLSWKLQCLSACHEVLTWIMYATHPLLGWDMGHSNAWYVWAQRFAIFSAPWTAGGSQATKGTSLGILYSTLALQAVYVAMMVHITWASKAQRHGRFVYHEKKWARVLEVVLFKLLAVALLGTSLLPVTCNASLRVPSLPENAALLVPGNTCEAMRPHMFSGVLAATVQVAMYLLQTLKDCPMDPYSKEPLALANPGALTHIGDQGYLEEAHEPPDQLQLAEGGSRLTLLVASVRLAALKVLTVLCFHFLVGVDSGFGGVLLALCWLWVTYVHVVRVPFHGRAHGIARATWAGAVLGLFTAVAAKGSGASEAQTLLAALFPFTGAAAGAGAWLRLRAAYRIAVKFSELGRDVVPEREVHKFMDDEHADLVMRAVAWRGATAKTDPVSGGAVAAVAHAEHVHFRTATATILLAVAQAYLVGSVAMARSTLAKVDMAKASLLEIIMLLTLETALGEARDGAGNELDLASALELQQRVGNAHKSHKETLEALRDTWKLCIRSRVGPIGVQRVLMRIEARESHADMQYRLLLQRYSTHPTLLRSYGVFLQTLKGSTAAGARYIQEADKLDAVASDEQREAVHNATEEPLPGKEGPSEWEEVVVAASADGTITAVNGAIQRLLGYRNGELLGRTIGTLMPHAVAALHPAYMRSSRLGVGEQSGPRNLLGLSKAGYGVPLSIIVTRTRRHDKMGFMAQIRPRSIEPPWPGTTLVLWMTHGGVIMAANEALCSTLGYPAWELQRKPALTIVDRAALDKIADLAAGAEGAEEDDMGESPQSLLLHVMLVPKKRSDELQAPLLRCDGVVVLEGQGRSSYIMLALKRVWEEEALLRMSLETGQVTSATGALLDLLQLPESAVRGAYLTQLMARPVATLHSAVWAVQGGEDSRDLVPFLAPCMFGRPVEIASAGGVTCWVRLEPSEREMDDHGGAVLELRVEPCAQEELAADSTVRMEVGVGGAITLTAGGQAFGWGESVPSLLEEALVVAEGASAELLEEWQRRVSDEVEFCVPCMARCADNTAVAAVLRVRDGSLETEGGSRRGEGHSVGSRKGRRGSRPGNKMRLSLDLVRLDTVRVIAHVGRLGEVLKVSTQVETLSDLLGGLGEKIKAMLPGGEEMLKKLMRSVAAQNRCTPRVGGAELELQDGVRARCTVQAALPQDAQEAYVFVWMSPDNVFPALGLTVGSEVGTEARNGFQSGAPAGMRVAPHPGWEAIPLSPSDMAPITKIREELHKSDVEQAADPEEAGKREGTEGSMMGQEIEDEHKDNKKIDDEGDHASKGSEEAATALTFERPTPPDMSSLLSFIDSREEHRQSDAGAEVSMAPGLLEHLQSRGGGEQPAAQRGGESRDVGEEETSPGGKVSRDSKEGVERATVVPTEGSKREESRNSGAEEMDDSFKWRSVATWVAQDGASRRLRERVVTEASLSESPAPLQEEFVMALQKAFQSKDARRGKNREGATGTEKGVQNGGVREPEEGREGEPIDDHKREELQKMTPVQPGEGIAKRGSTFMDVVRDAMEARHAGETGRGALGSRWRHTKRRVMRMSSSRAPGGTGDGPRGMLRLATPPPRLDAQKATEQTQAGSAREDLRGRGGDMEDDASDSKIFLEGGQESTKQLRRLHALLNSSLLIRPFRALRTALCFSIGALIALHTAALATLIALALQQRAFLEHLRSAGAQSRLLVEAVAFARALNAEVYGPAYLDGLDIRGGLESIADEIKANNTDLFDAASNVGGSRGKALGQLWTSADLAISMRPGSGEPEVMMTSFSDVMVMYVSAAYSVAAAAPPLGEDDFEIHLMEANVHGVIAPRAEQIEAMMQGHAESRLSLVARIALASLVLQAALSPLLAIVALRLLSRAKAVRLSLFSVLIAVPRPIAARFSQLPVSLGALEDELEGPAEPMQPQRSRAESKRTGGGGSVRDLLAVPISYAKVQAARTRLQAGAKRERGRGRRWVWVGAVLAPFALWTAVVTALQVITLRLKSREMDLLQARFASAVVSAQSIAMVTWSQSLTLAALEGKDEDTLSVLRDRLREACREVQLGQDALVFGSPDFKGKSIVSGAMWELPGLERLHFGAPCLRSAGDCLLPEEDPHAWLTGQGLYRLLVGMTDIACRLAEDPRESLTMQNSRVETVMGVGSRELRDGIRESERIVGSKISQIGSLVSLQVAAFVTTGVLALGIAFFVPLQLLSSHRRDMCRLAQVLSMLPQDMGIDKLLVEACSELYKKDDDDAEEAIREFVERMRDQTDAGSENGDEGAQKK